MGVAGWVVPGVWGGVWSRGVCSGGCVWSGGGGGIQACTEADSPLWTESQTPVKTLPWPNFVAAGKNRHLTNTVLL